MKIVLIHGQSHEGSTCHIARMLAAKIGGEMSEFLMCSMEVLCYG